MRHSCPITKFFFFLQWALQHQNPLAASIKSKCFSFECLVKELHTTTLEAQGKESFTYFMIRNNWKGIIFLKYYLHVFAIPFQGEAQMEALLLDTLQESW